MDLISGEEVTVSNFLKEDDTNIAFYFHNRVVSFITKDQVKQFYMDPSYKGTTIKYGCKSVEHSIIPRRENVELEEPYFTLRSIGANGLVKLSEMEQIMKTKTARCININSTPIKDLPSTASYQMIFSRNPNAVGSSHCQEGQGEKVYGLEIIPVTLTGGRKTIRKTIRKTKKRKHSVKRHRTSKRTRKIRRR